MKINSYEIGMDSARTYSSVSTRKLSVKVLGEKQTGLEGSFSDTYTNLSDEEEKNKTKVSDGENGKDAWTRYGNVGEIASERIGKANPHGAVRDIQSVRQQFVLYLWRMLFGEKSAKELSEKYAINDYNTYGDDYSNADNGFSVITLSGVEENYYSETETLDFSSSGNVTTSDGRVINFDVQLNMSRSFEQYYIREGIEIPQMCDPLVLNFDGNVGELTDTKFKFDLDCDGEEELISMICGGNGFLALDKNNDGVINDGSELFGTVSGDGFKDLAKYDEDHNGWIDENDSIFDKLKIWIKDEEGNDSLLSLKQKNVGAIYLGNSKGDFTIRSIDSGNINGAVRSNGIFLYEDGNVGVLSQLDIAN